MSWLKEGDRDTSFLFLHSRREIRFEELVEKFCLTNRESTGLNPDINLTTKLVYMLTKKYVGCLYVGFISIFQHSIFKQCVRPTEECLYFNNNEKFNEATAAVWIFYCALLTFCSAFC